MKNKIWFNVITFILLITLAFITSPLIIDHETYSNIFSHIDKIISGNLESVLSRYGFFIMIVISCLYILALIH